MRPPVRSIIGPLNFPSCDSLTANDFWLVRYLPGQPGKCQINQPC
jgi:hypothetical protein